jgi:CheY-like chemotaxis protein
MSEQKYKSWSGKTILLVDDDDVCGILLSEILISYDINLIHIKDSSKALHYCCENKNIDLVLMDIMLPVMNGYKATMLIKKLFPTLPVVAFTVCIMPEEKKKCFEAGCDDIIPKPFKIDDFLSKIDTFLKN